jgi:hypothetical protein
MSTTNANVAPANAPAKPTPVMLPWPLIVAVLISYTALFLFTQDTGTSDSSILVAGLGLALLATRMIKGRIAHASWAPWVFRVVGIGFVVSNFPRTDTGHPMLFDPASVALFGMMWAIEATIQSWRQRPWGNPPGSSLILMSIVTFTSAATIGEDYASGPAGNYVAYLTPAFLLFIILSFRALERQSESVPDRHIAGVLRVERQAENTVRRVSVLRWSALGGALLAGYICWVPVHLYRQQISTWGNNLLESRDMPEPTGLSTAPALGDMFNADGSPTRVLRIDNYTGDPHLRGLSFETYSRGRWLPTEDALRFDTATAKDLNSNARGTRARVHVYADGLKELVTPLNLAGIAPPPDAEVEISRASGTVLKTSLPTPWHYDLIQSATETNQGILCTPITQAERTKCLTVPEDIDPQVWDLAHRIWQSEKDTVRGNVDTVRRELGLETVGGNAAENGQDIAEAKIAAVSKYLMSHYSYALTAHSGNGDKISHFLLHEHSAHCEYFASASVMLLRILGVPSRYVTGYYAHETEGGSTIVRQRDSHAWTECWIDGVGWVTVDTTPGGGRPDQLYPRTALMTRIWEWMADRIMDAREFAARFTPMELSLGVAGFAAVFYGLRFLITLRRRRRVAVVKVEYESRNEALIDMARLYEDYLAKAGVPCPPNQPWIEHLEGLRIPKIVGDNIADQYVEAGGRLRPPSPQSMGNKTRVAEGSTEKSLIDQIDLTLATEFVRNYNALRFRKSFDVELAKETRAILEQLIGKEAN